MKLTEVAQLSEATFTPQNFPAAPNKRFSGAGERTIYAELPVNQPGGIGFRIPALTKVVKSRNRNVAQLKANTRIFWTLPAKLFTAAEVGEKATSNYAWFGLKSSLQKDAIGLVAISAVEKSAKVPGRVMTGKIGQSAVFKYIKQTYSEEFESIEQLDTAKAGSQRADLLIAFDGQPYQFEVKNSTKVSVAASVPVTLFDKTVRRDKPHPIIDGMVSVMSGKARMTLVKAIDKFRETDKTIGFPGDKGVGKSGKFGGIRIFKDDPFMIPTYDFILEHLIASGDSYFAINHIDHVVKIYYTGYGKNILKAPKLPLPKVVYLETYGGPSLGGMRIGVKIKL